MFFKKRKPMWILIISLIALALVAATAGIIRNRKLQKEIDRGELDAMPEVQEVDAECCGQHEICERDSLLAAVSKQIEYYDDEELDKYIGTAPDAYTPEQEDEFRDVFYTMQDTDVAGWVRSLQLRGIALPDNIKDEVFLIIGERRLTHFFPTCPHRQFAGKHCLRADRHVHRYPETSVHQRRIDACIFWRYRPGIVYRHFPHSVGSLVCSLVRFRCRVAQQTEGHAGRLRHCRILDIGHGTGHHVHFPLAGIRTRLVRLSLRQHSHDYLERHRSIGRACPAADTVFRAVSPSHHLRSLRPGVCPLARYSGAGIRICTDDVHCADHRGMPAHGGHRAGHFAAHRSADDRQLVLAPVPPHHLAFHRHRLPQLPGRADDFFLLECPLGCIHHILFHHYLCHLQDRKKFLAIFATLNQKTQWKSKFSH